MRCVDGLDIFDMGGDDYSSGLEVDVRRKLLEANDVARNSLAALALELPERESGAPLGVRPLGAQPGDAAGNTAMAELPGEIELELRERARRRKRIGMEESSALAQVREEAVVGPAPHLKPSLEDDRPVAFVLALVPALAVDGGRLRHRMDLHLLVHRLLQDQEQVA